MANKSISGDVNVEFNEAQSRQSLESGESVKTLFGKLRKWLTDLGTAAFTNSTDYAAASHNQSSSTITAMTGYSKPQATSAITATDTLNEAIGKLEKGLDGAGTPNDGVLTIQQNGTTLGTFSANQAGNTTINIQAISTTMTSSAVNTSDGAVTIKEDSTNVGITDSISYSNLAIGATYTLKTRVYDATTGYYLSITKDGVTSTEISTTITPTANNGVYINAFSIDSTVGIAVDSTIAVNEILSMAENTIAESISFLTVIELVVKLGLRANFVNSTFTRLGDAVGLSGGSNFDDFPMYRRRRCNLSDSGVVNAYYGDSGYKTDGSNGQVMVEQPKFYYKVVPVTLNDSDSKQLDVAEYWVSNKPLDGYKLHPAFKNTSGKEINYFYEGAYEGYISSSKLGSISGVKSSSNITIAGFRTAATTRGSGWRQETIWSLSADQILMIIEYGMFNMQVAIGKGNTNSSNDLYTGTLNSYGNGTYGTTANTTTAVQWRGKENPWGNKYAWIDGINFNGYVPYIANSYSFSDDTSTNYTQLGFNIANGSGQYFGRFGYDSTYDWIFIPYGSVTGDSSVPIGDCSFTNSYGWLAARSGGYRNDESKAGLFCLFAYYSSSNSYSMAGGRALYVG